MTIHQVTDCPTSDLARALERFEEQFTYPLGPGRSFRISHGDDYSRFFRAIGEAVCFVAERDGEVLGVLGLAATRLRTANGEERAAIYLGDLKIARSARSGWVLHRLVGAARKWCDSRAECAFGVVMDGTSVTPDSYTGRLGIPLFQSVAKIAVLRLPTAEGNARDILDAGHSDIWRQGAPSPPATPPTRKRGESYPSLARRACVKPSRVGDAWEANPTLGAACFAKLSAGRVCTNGGNPTERSQTSPVWLVAPDGSACGRLEDTRRAKRLIEDDGTEMVAAHLSSPGYQNPSALAELLQVARAVAADQGFPALFVAIPPSDAAIVVAFLGEPGIVVAPATVYAAGLESGQTWSINTAEI